MFRIELVFVQIDTDAVLFYFRYLIVILIPDKLYDVSGFPKNFNDSHN